MNEQSGYKQQQRLSFTQFLAEVPDFIAIFVSLIFSRSLIVLVDLLDSFGDMLRTATITLLSKKLSRDLKFEYNYGVGKIEAIAALLCDGIVFFGLFITLGLSVYEIIFPSAPSGFLIAVVGLKVINVSFDTFFYVKQRKIIKQHYSAISKSNYAAAIAALLFDSVTLVSLLVIWLLRNNPISGYITPVISIAIAIYLMVGCVKRIRTALEEITDKTLPEDIQLKILRIMSIFNDRYSQFYAVKSRKNGNDVNVDLYISFDDGATFADITKFKAEVQEKMSEIIDNCTVNIVVEENASDT